MSKWLENAMERGKNFLLDLGYVNNPITRKHGDELFSIISKRNLEIVSYGRVLVNIPPTKLNVILSKFAAIKEGEGYSWTTHKWPYEGWNDIKWAWK
jgi:hypothetical protein